MPLVFIFREVAWGGDILSHLEGESVEVRGGHFAAPSARVLTIRRIRARPLYFWPRAGAAGAQWFVKPVSGPEVGARACADR
jgi:hypothetical protein